MNAYLNRVKAYIKKEIVMLISGLLAAVSAALVPIGPEYIGYIDFRTLGILFCLMTVTAGLKNLGVFSDIGRKLIAGAGDLRKLTVILVMLCFFSSMMITNDVALITFVPFAVEVLSMSGAFEYMIPVIVLQTLAANAGSMLTPIGNPQNLFLYTVGRMNLADFIGIMLPYTLTALAVLLIGCILSSKKLPAAVGDYRVRESCKGRKRLIVMYAGLFLISLASVANIIPFTAAAAITLAAVLILDRGTIADVDYSLLLTFVFLFVFIGNMKTLPTVNSLLSRTVNGHELVTSVLMSQLISNVPAAVLLSGFTENIRVLMVGVNIGGFGTVIASMASLISFKLYANTDSPKTGRYMKVFTMWNIVMLLVLTVLACLLIQH